MKKTLIGLILALPAVAQAQSAPDAYMLSQTETRGTARFMSMGGAFTALGGDLSTLGQNPAGIGVYRRSEIGATIDVSPRTITSTSNTDKISNTKTNVACNNFGYIGTVNLDGALQTFSWGASYNRLASFDRTFTAYNGSTATSLSNYVASYTNNDATAPSTMEFGETYNPYFDSNADWLSILSYSASMINPVNGSYHGLYQNGTKGDALSHVRETGYVDEYNIDFGGNVSNVLMWGIGFGITDLNYNSTSYYSESMENAYIRTATNRMTTGNAGFEIGNYRNINGTGFNVKLGVILKPVNALRIGLAVHTPTWYSLTSNSYADVSYSYLNPNAPENDDNPLKGDDYTENSIYHFRLKSPWKLMFGVAGVIGNNAIISADYERQQYPDMSVKYQGNWGQYVDDDLVNGDIDEYYKAADIFRLGAEYRVTPKFSVRAGYNFTSSTSKTAALDGDIEIFTAGTNPAYTLNRETNAISLGAGYRFSFFYIDAAYVFQHKNSEYKAYTNYGNCFGANATPGASLSEKTNSLIVSLGVKF